MYKRLKLFTPVIATLMALCAVLVLITPLFDTTLFFISAALALAAFAVVMVMLRRVGKSTRAMLEEIGDGILYTGEGDYIDFPVPVITVYEGSEIIWYNRLCYDKVFGGNDLRGEDITEVLPGLNVAPENPEDGQSISWGQRRYTAFVASSRRQGESISIIYLLDDTELKETAAEYHRTRPSVAIITVDNYDEMMQDVKDSERAQFMSEIEDIIEQYCSANYGFFIRIQRDKFMAVFEEQGLDRIIAAKFDVLDRVRALVGPGRFSATLSIGVGRGAESLTESNAMARQAMDMCLGRGGDQVALRTSSGYEFFGGVSKGVEKRTKVKTRIIASALAELIEASRNVVIMGHRFADLDSIGSCMGMLKSVKAMNRPAIICMDREKNLVSQLMQKLSEEGYPEGDIQPPAQVLERIDAHTLLIVLDTHVPQVLESMDIYKACKTVVVIDHHRKLVNHIDNAVIFYHEPYASSACEMVAELIQYFPTHPQISKLEAEAMLAGIMLDTKNFVLRTGVRTFEAAAYLRRLGADTVAVRKLFASSMENYQQKSDIVSKAEVYHHCAIAVTTEPSDNIKVVAPQAADELMSIEGVDASFVIFPYENVINVSARSMGNINVQVIMEKLGGGGHHTMAAAQFPDADIRDISAKIMDAIDGYYESLAQPPA